jgi:hypothetical protein
MNAGQEQRAEDGAGEGEGAGGEAEGRQRGQARNRRQQGLAPHLIFTFMTASYFLLP